MKRDAPTRARYAIRQKNGPPAGNIRSEVTATNMDKSHALHSIEHASSEDEVLEALRGFVGDPANGHDNTLGSMVADEVDVPGVALELTRRRLEKGAHHVPEDLVAVFARASVRIAELLDRTGRCAAYRIRSAAR